MMWQLYLFGVTHLIPIVFPLVNMCGLFSGKDSCNEVEKFMLIVLGYAMIYVGLFSLVLARINNDDAPKLKRLAMVLTNCASATLAGVIMFGSAKLGGYEQSLCHLGDMIWMILLVVALTVATADEAPPAGPVENLLTGMGINCKTFLVLIEVGVLAKMFAFTDMMSFSFFLEEPDQVTPLASAMWRLAAIMMFEMVLIIWFVLAYGNEKDHESVIFCCVAMVAFAFIYLIPVMGAYKHGMLLSAGLPSLIIFIILAVIAVTVGRKQRANAGSGGSPLLG